MVSIIIPCHNYGNFISETIESILGQTYKDWECIIVDDGSTDDTKDVVKSFSALDSRIKYIYQHNSGVSYARNNGLRNSCGDYIQFLDADDLLISSKIESHVNYLNCNSDVDIVYGPVRYFDNGNFENLRESLDMSLMPWMPEVSGKGLSILSQLIKCNIMVIQSPLIKRRLFNETGFFYESLRYNEDWFLWIMCALVGMNFAYDKSMSGLSYVRVHRTSASQNRVKMLVGELEMRYLLSKELVKYNHKDLAEYNINKIKELNYVLGHMLFNAKDYASGIRLYINSAKFSRNFSENFKHVINHLKANLLNKIINFLS